jgi:hypothetical protein
MDSTSSFGQGGEKSSSGAELRRDARFKVNVPEAYRVNLTLGHKTLPALCTDYSPFGLGLRLELKPDLPLFSIGESVDLQCDFHGSKFSARGTIANTRVERGQVGDFVRLGIALSRSAEVVRPAHVKRRLSRIQMNEAVAPLVYVADELRLGETVFAKMTDVSQGGMRLLIDRHPLPFMEKQRYWFEIVLPVFGICRAYGRIAYVRREEAGKRYIIGCEFIDGGEEQELRPLADWLFYAHTSLSKNDISEAGFKLAHLTSADEEFRILVSCADSLPSSAVPRSGSEDGHSSPVDSLEFYCSRGTETYTLRADFSALNQSIQLKAISSLPDLESLRLAFWKCFLLFAMHNKIKSIVLDDSFRQTEFILKSCTTMPDAVALTPELILSGDLLKYSLWRKLYNELGNREGFTLPKPSSFIRRWAWF